MVEASLEEVPAAPSPTAETLGPSSGAPATDAGHLQEETTKALGELLGTKSSISANWQKLVWELGMSLCQTDSETTESIKEAKAICIRSTQEAKTLCSTTIKEAKATLPTPSRKPKPFAPWLSGTWRPKELPRLTHFTDHMPSPSSAWTDKPLRKRIRVSSTSYLPVKLPSEPALWNSTTCW